MRAILKDRYGFTRSDMSVQNPPPSEVRMARTTFPAFQATDAALSSEYQHTIFRLVRIAKSAYADDDTAMYEEYDIEMQSKATDRERLALLARAKPAGIQPPVEYKKRMMRK